jgi:AcrR family transcriptional regulator
VPRAAEPSTPQPPAPDAGGADARETAAAAPRRGRPRDATIDTRVAHAVIELYAQFGWAGLTFDEVARRAKVGKAALYLRWSSKEDLLVDCMANVRARREPHTYHEIRADLTAIARSLLSFYASPTGLAYLRLYVESRYVPGLEERWRQRHTTPMFLDTRSLVHDAVARGELPKGTSPTIVLDALTGAIANHVLSTPPELFSQMEANAPEYVDALVDMILAGARAAAP